uniref:Nucleoporin NSP1-like C-terminal domain-containing protein n=1 Tax=Chenopodium quinoa TaxID=63459 RepID=A0A803LIA3_CHEQI
MILKKLLSGLMSLILGFLATTSVSAAISSSTTTAVQTSSVVAVASSSGTTSAVSTPVTSAPTPKLPSEITGKTVEEIIKEWNSELQDRTRKFQKQANAIADWDKRILQNRDVLLRLEVDKALDSIEEEAERIYKDERNLLLDDEAASTRDAMYDQAESVERELEHMTEQIKSIIQSLNASQGGELDTTEGMSPLDVVVRILNNQLSSLMWIDEKAEEFSFRIQNLASEGSAADRVSLEKLVKRLPFRLLRPVQVMHDRGFNPANLFC